MSAYNRLNGTFCSEHPWLIEQVVMQLLRSGYAVVTQWLRSGYAVVTQWLRSGYTVVTQW